MKPLSLKEIFIIQEYEDWDDLGLNDDFERLLHTAREYHRLREALEEIAKKVPDKVDRNEAADMACEFKIVACEALKESEGE